MTSTPPILRRRAVAWAASLMAVSLIGASCTGPLERTAEEELREQLLSTSRSYIHAVQGGPQIELSREPSDVEAQLTDQRRAELDSLSGPASYVQEPLELGNDLMGEAETRSITLSLQQAVRIAVENNLQVQEARLRPAISQARLTQAEAVFDAVYFAELNLNKLDTPQPALVAGIGRLGPPSLTDDRSLNTGIRKPLTTGGQVTVSTGFSRNSSTPTVFAEDPHYEANALVSLSQPLLRNFGSDVNRAQILLSQNARRSSIEELRDNLLTTVNDVEQAYWDLVFTRQQLLVELRLLKRAIETRRPLLERREFDVSPVQLTQANATVEERRARVIRVRQQVRLQSDRLKQLLNSPELPLSGEIMIQPADMPTDLPVQFNLLDAVTTALQRRPEPQQALLAINDASIRQRVADNQRLPLLNLAATARFNGVGSNIGESYETVGEGDFIDYILSAQFEAPIGNRAAQALYREQQIAREASVIAYQAAAQQAVLDVKQSLRSLIGTYELIGATRATRRAAADNLRALEEQEKAGQALTPEFLDLKFRRQDSLAEAETAEARALTDYNTAIAAMYRAMGVLLERCGIELADPEAPATTN